ncbi:MAG: holo-ACP synthase [Fimbriimonadaceae bacterium]
MIVRVGVDQVSVERIRGAMARPGFVQRILTERERSATELGAERLAGRWAAKEAVAKALLAKPGWHDVQIFNGPEGEPYAEVGPKWMNGEQYRMHLSISHERKSAIAFAVLEKVLS